MKIRDIGFNNRKKEFMVTVRSGIVYSFPYAKAIPCPSKNDCITDIFVDKELGSEAFSFILKSGNEGSVHIEQVLEFNKDPTYLADLLVYKLTLEAQNRIKTCGLSRRQIAKQLHTSVPQLYRLLDTANTGKTINQIVALLHILNCDVELMVKSSKTQPHDEHRLFQNPA